MQLNYIKINSKEMKNMIQNESYLELEEAKGWEREREREPFDWKQVTIMALAFVWGDEFTTK